MRIPYTCTNANDHFCNYYLKQAAYGLPAYAGSRHQKGHGFFSNLFCSAIPLLKRGGISLVHHLFKTGSNIVNDVEAGKSLGESAKRRFIETGKGVIIQITGNQARQGYQNRIKKCCKRKAKSFRSQPKKRQVTVKESDIFSI